MKQKNRPLSREAQRKFLDLVEVNDPADCWEWKGSIMRGDYPIFYGDGKQVPAVRMLYRIYYNNHLRKDWVIQHTCENNLCMNPNHIYRDSRSEAARATQIERRRFTSGENHPQSRLTAKDIRKIRQRVADGEMQKSLAEEYGVTKTHISKIVNRKVWRHI